MTTTMMDDATVSEERGSSFTKYRVAGGLSAVLKVVESLFTNYPAMGYGTHVDGMGSEGGQYVAHVSRLTSCE